MRFLAGQNLGKKIFLLAAGGLLLGIGIFSFLALRAVGQAVDTMLEDRLALARSTAGYVDSALTQSLSRVSASAGEIDLRTDEATLDRHIDDLEADLMHQAIRMSGAFIISPDGTIDWSRPGQPGVPSIDLVSEGVMQSVSANRATISGLVMSPALGVPSVLLTAPGLTDRDGESGVLVVAADIEESSIAGLVQPLRLGATGYVEIVDQDGLVVLRTEPGPRQGLYETSDHSERFAALIAAGTATRGVCHSCHEPVSGVQGRDVLAFAPLSEADWGIVVRQSEGEALAPIRELRRDLLLAGVGMLLIASVVIAVITRDVVSRTRMLTEASQRIAGGDLVTPIHLAPKDELGMLAGSLDDMRKKLRASYEELERRTGELTTLLTISDLLASVPAKAGLETVLNAVLEKTAAIMKADAAEIVLRDEETGAFCHRPRATVDQGVQGGVCCLRGEGLVGGVLESGEAVQVEDVGVDPRATDADRVLAGGLRGFAGASLRSKNGMLGVLTVATREPRRFSQHDMRLLESIGGQIATASENVRLQQEVQRDDEVRRELLREVLAIQEEDRRRIARELHDETSQVLASLTANLEAIAGVLPEGADRAAALVKKTEGLSVKILDEIHRLIYELRPSLLDDMGLVSAVRWLAENNLEKAGVDVDVKIAGRSRRLDPELEATLFRVIQEAMNNIVRHARATRASVILQFRRSMITVHLSDNGTGFDVREAVNPRHRPHGLGLIGMKERVELVNGTLDIRSAPGSGTEVHVKIPVCEEDEHGKDQSLGGG